MRFLIGFIVGLLVVPLFGWAYLSFGYAPVATASNPLPFEKYLAKMALAARVDREAPHKDPNAITEAGFLEGARLYREQCAVCHGLPAQAETAIAKGMFPKPPQLFKGKGVTDDPVGETYWKIKNGIRLSGMPAFGDGMNQERMWDIAELLAKADKLPETVTRTLH